MEFVNPAEDFIIFGEDRKLDAARTLEAVRRRVACQPGLALALTPTPTRTLTLTRCAAAWPASPARP
eukprot:scaffold132260_cov30-Phaeocystis_antarctica.AAC.1